MIVEDLPRIAEAEHLIPDLLRVHPEAHRVLDRQRLRGPGDGWGPTDALVFFPRAHGVDEATLLREIDEAIAHPDLGAPAIEVSHRVFIRQELPRLQKENSVHFPGADDLRPCSPSLRPSK